MRTKNSKKNLAKKVTKINTNFMTSYMKYLFLLSFAVICALFIAHNHSLAVAKAKLLSVAPDSNLYLQVVQEQAQNFYKMMILTMMCFFICVCILTNSLTKQVSRPVNTLIKHLEEMPDLSQVRKIRFKKGDVFEELMKAFNFFITRGQFQGEKVAVHEYDNKLKI